jgi:membrane protein implicated in regulation of membrane protease activity
VDDDLSTGGAPDRTKIRIGLAIISFVVLVSIVLFIALDEPFARVLFAGIAVVALFQMWRIRRVVQGEQPGS